MLMLVKEKRNAPDVAGAVIVAEVE